MKTFIKTFACAAVAAILLVSCNDTSLPNASNEEDSSNNANSSKQVVLYDPPILIIADDVQQWMEKQLAAKSGEKRLISTLNRDYQRKSGNIREYLGRIFYI